MTQTQTRGQQVKEEKLPAQYINYIFFQLDPLWRRLPDEERERGKREFLEAAEEHSGEMLLRSFSLMGLRADADFMLWRIGYDLDVFEGMTGALLKTGLGKYLRVSYSYFALSRRSIYVGEHTPGFENRTYIVPGEGEYLFVYPFVKTREWYRLPIEERQRMMNEHMQIGRKHYPVKNNTGYCFGIARPAHTLSSTPLSSPAVAVPCRRFCNLWDKHRSCYRIGTPDSGILPGTHQP